MAVTQLVPSAELVLPLVGDRRPRLRSVALAVAALVLAALAAKGHSLPMTARAIAGTGSVAAAYRCLRVLGRSRWGPAWDLAGWCALSWLGLLGLAAALAPVLPLPEATDSSRTLSAPVLARPDLGSAHLLGTDALGLDLLSRVIHGARVSLTVSLSAVLIGLLVGGTIGVVAGYVGRGVDRGVGLAVDAWLAFPPLILLLTLAVALGRGMSGLIVGLGLIAIPINIRLARATTLAISGRGFVRAAEALGTPRRRILGHELAPAVATALITYSVAIVASLIVAEASLSFLGLGVAPPTPSWGAMIAEGQNGMFEDFPHLVAVPGLVLFFTVVSLNIVGERVRQRWAVGGTVG